MKSLLFIALVATLTFGCKSQQAQIDETATAVEKKSTESGDRTRGDRTRGDRKAPPTVDEVFQMDANNDGQLSKTEVEGPLARRFDTMDSNSDGFITREEFENAPKPQRKQRGSGNN